jgi:hypothetical protein
MSNFPTFAYYSHHKCATGWTNSILRELCFHLGLRHRTAHGPQQYGSHGSLRTWVETHGVEFLAFTNAKIDQATALSSHRGFHVVRDPRDVLVSGYFSHLHSHPTDDWPELQRHRDELQSLSKEEGLLREIEFSRRFFEDMKAWDYSQDHILEVKMESLTSAPQIQFLKVLRHLGLWRQEASASYLRQFRQRANRGVYAIHHRVPGPLPQSLSREHTIDESILASVLEAHTFDKMAGGRSKGEENEQSHYRKGKSGDWKNHFTEAVADAFHEAYGDVVVRLGYE